MHPLIVIPARYGSTRIPGKPLSKIDGEPLISLVARRVLEFGLGSDVVVATDDSRISDALSSLDVRTVFTSPNHRSGTERAAEVARLPEYAAVDPILNIQGDQPFLPRHAAEAALEQLGRGYSIGTAAARLEPNHEADPARVKVSVDRNGVARSFSRDMPGTGQGTGEAVSIHLHLGVYCYTRRALLEWVSLPPTAAEFDQGLEQLRPFLHGIPIGVAVLDETVEHGIDSPRDLVNARNSLATTRTNA